MAIPAPRPDRPPLPFTPADLPADKLFVRACLAHCVAATRPGEYAADISRSYWPRDPATLALIERAATAPAMLGTTGWAAELAGKSIEAFIGSLQESAAAKLITAAPRFDMPGISTISLPHASSTGTPLWVAEGAPIPVAQAVIAAPTLGPPKKLALLEVISREIAETSVGGGEAVISIVLRDSMTRQLDLSVFSATAGDATRPGGILAGVSGLTPTTGGGLNACLADLRGLVAATVSGGGSGNILFVTSPSRALAIAGYLPHLIDRVAGGAAIPDTLLVAIDPHGFASMFGPDPEIRAAIESTLHFEDTSPLQIGTAGSPTTVAAPARSLFQTDLIALRAILRCAWVMRVPGAVSFVSNPTW